eukprot:g33072.t1
MACPTVLTSTTYTRVDFQSGQSTGPKKDPITQRSETLCGEVSKCAAQLGAREPAKVAAKGAAPPVLPPWPPVAAATSAAAAGIVMGVAVGAAANVAHPDRPSPLARAGERDPAK